ncbi:DUF5592 family protein [Anaerovoracaceae bacterium 41-7]|uniref:DUF5592 family protein n=1 Tax=Emergencia sp. 1XD21-10 TaxID=2304569 RepID=UPI001379DE53|nr:DUF5592 family protein [Emergencia sp. 1XD21-10]NCF00514.1 hypothetical protein [Emergencia sp. 1XD21-10]
MKYLITEEIESPNRVFKNVEALDFFFVLSYMAIVYALKAMVHPSLHIPYYIFSLFCCIFLTCRSAFNRKRRNMESVFLLLKHNTAVYKAVYGEEVQGLAAEIEKE